MASSSEPWVRQPCRLIVDGPADGAWNMAFDEALLESAAERGGWTLRFYQWSQPTLSLGYFQRFEDRQRHAASLGCPCVRRASGGGAILHDAELTYSLIVPGTLRMRLLPAVLYELVHEALAESLQEVASVAAVLHESTLSEQLEERPQPFLCFQRRAEGDLLVGSAKIAGSAQRRLRRAVLQHGSVLLQASPSAPELPGLESCSPRAFRVEDLRETWTQHMASTLELDLIDEGDLAWQRQRAAELASVKYSTQAWTCRR